MKMCTNYPRLSYLLLAVAVQGCSGKQQDSATQMSVVSNDFKQVSTIGIVHDFGDVQQGETPTHNFEICNPTNEIIRVEGNLERNSGCKCTYLKIEKDEINIGESIAIACSFNSVARVGPFEESAQVVFVGSNGFKCRWNLTIKGSVSGRFEVFPEAVFFSEDEVVGNCEKNCKVQFAKNVKVSSLRILDPPKGLSVVFCPISYSLKMRVNNEEVDETAAPINLQLSCEDDKGKKLGAKVTVSIQKPQTAAMFPSTIHCQENEQGALEGFVFVRLPSNVNAVSESDVKLIKPDGLELTQLTPLARGIYRIRFAFPDQCGRNNANVEHLELKLLVSGYKFASKLVLGRRFID